MFISLSSESKSIDTIINFPNGVNKDNFISLLETFCKSYTDEYYFIVHDRDILQISGEIKTIHIHCLFKISKRKRLKTILNDLSAFLGVDNCLISITKWSNYEQQIQYLIHKNDKEKVRYNISEIHSNKFNDLEDLMKRDIKPNITFEYLCYLVQNNDDIIKVYQTIGINYIHRYKSLIHELFELKWKGQLKDTSNY